jgi:hypothetical protein
VQHQRLAAVLSEFGLVLPKLSIRKLTASSALFEFGAELVYA